MPPPRTRASRWPLAARSLSMPSASSTVREVSIAACVGVISSCSRRAPSSSRSLSFDPWSPLRPSPSDNPAMPRRSNAKAGKSAHPKKKTNHQKLVKKNKTATEAATTGIRTASEVVTLALGLMLSTSRPIPSQNSSASGLRRACPSRRFSSSRSGFCSKDDLRSQYISSPPTRPRPTRVAQTHPDANLPMQARRRISMETERRIEESKDALLEELKEFLRMPSISARGGDDPGFRACAEWVAAKLGDAGAEARIKDTDGPAPGADE